MKKTHWLCRSMARVLHELQEKHKWFRTDSRVFFLAGHWKQDVMGWVAGHQRKGLHPKRHATRQGARTRQPESWTSMDDEAASRIRFLRTTVGEKQCGCLTDNLFYVFADTVSDLHVCHESKLKKDVIELPFTVAEAVSYVRRLTSRFSGSGLGLPPLCLGPGAGVAQGHSGTNSTSLKSHCAAFLQKQTADLLAVDLFDPMQPECPFVEFHARQNVVDTLALGAHLLKPTGALVMRFPVSTRWRDEPCCRAVMRHMRWSFQVAASEVVDGQFYCMGCRAGAEQMIAAKPKSVFSAFSSRVSRVSRGLHQKWNPRRNGPTRGYVVAHMPNFATISMKQKAPNVVATEEANALKKAEEKAEAFFNLSMEMVRKGAYNTQRDE